MNGKDVVCQENITGIWNGRLWKREALSESIKQKPAPGKCWWWGWWWERVPCWQEEPTAFDQPVLKETPGAWNETLKHRPHPFVFLHWSAFCIQRNSVKIWICRKMDSPMDFLYHPGREQNSLKQSCHVQRHPKGMSLSVRLQTAVLWECS